MTPVGVAASGMTPIGKATGSTTPATMTSGAAEEIAIAALTFVARDYQALDRFVRSAGIDPAEIRQIPREDLLRGVLTYLTESEDLLLVFAHAHDLQPGHAMLALRALSGLSRVAA